MKSEGLRNGFLAGVARGVILATGLSLVPLANAKGPDPFESDSAHNAKGYDRGTAFVRVDAADIDAFNFNFVAQFPLAIGLEYPENAGLSLQLNLTYNSRVSNWQQRFLHRKAFRVRRQNPFGLGFDLSLGKIINTTVGGGTAVGHLAYVDGSGATHKLKLVDGSTNEYRSHDGSRIRAVKASDDSSWTVSFSSGLVQVLGHRISGTPLPDLGTPPPNSPHSCNPTEDGENNCPGQFFIPDSELPTSGFDRDYVGWHVTKVLTRAATCSGSLCVDSPSYTIEYYGDDGTPSDLPFAHIIKEITDQHQRTIQFEINRSLGVVTEIRTPAPATENGTARTAVWSLEYDTATISGLPLHPSGITSHQVRVLTKVSGPDLGAGQRYVHQFAYWSDGDVVGGRIKQLTYPSGKVALVNYQEYLYANGSSGYCMGGSSPAPCPPSGGTCSRSWGVASIETFLDGDTSNPNLTNPLYRKTAFSQHTQYRDYKFWGAGDCEGAPYGRAGYKRYDQVNRMVDAAGNTTDFVYRTPKEETEENWYGLLLSEVYRGGTAEAPDEAALLKEVEYDYEQLGDPAVFGPNAIDFDMVVNQIKTTWADDKADNGSSLPDATVMIEDRSGFDAFGHHQRAEFWGNSIGVVRKVVIRDYASDSPYAGELSDNWLGDVLIREEVRARWLPYGEWPVSRTDYRYDCSTGLRKIAIRRATLESAVFPELPVLDPCENSTPLVGDVVTQYSYFPNGDLETEHRFISGTPADVTPSDVTTKYTYSYGALESVKNLGLGYYDYVRIIDQSSGLMTEERSNPTSPTDASAVKTKFAYDILGRVTKVAFATDDPLNIAYEHVGTAHGARLVRVRSSQGSGSMLTESVDHFAAARLDREEKVNPDSSRAFRYTEYNPAGRASYVSEWTRQTTSAGVPGTRTDYGVYDGTTYLFEDPFGRPTKMTDPIGGVTRFRYFGTNKEVIKENVALKADALEDPASISMKYYIDGIGRLRFVSKPKVISPGAGHGPYEATGVAAHYNYDVLGQLLLVQLSASGQITPDGDLDRYTASAPSPQNRTFEYDSLGRLTSSTAPETGTTHNEKWNVFGGVTRSRDAEAIARGYALHTTFDVAGRPTKVSKVATSSTTNYTFTPATGGLVEKSDWRNDHTGNCLLGTPSWYIGKINCQYAVASSIDNAELESGSLQGLGSDAVLSFKYFREVHGDPPGTTGRDVLKVQVRDTGANPSTWKDVFVLDSSQVSWSKWMRSPAISLAPFLPSIGDLRVQFVFDSGGQNTEASLRGIGIAEVNIGQPNETILQETFYDEGLAIANNRSLGKPTRIMEYDESTRTPIFTRELHYATAAGRLSDDRLTLDWGRDGTPTTLVSDYAYDSQGRLSWQRMPRIPGTPRREYNYTRSFGALQGITVSEASAIRNVVGADMGIGIEYDDSGGVKLIRFANRVQQHIARNAASMPSRIWVDRDGFGTPVFDTGTYAYDGASNIKQIGSDYYRYDADGRLTWSRTTSSSYGTVDLDHQYDVVGNMTAQLASFPFLEGTAPTLPNGLVFSGRSFGTATNRVQVPSGFSYDAAGKLRSEPAHDGLAQQSYRHSASGDLTEVTNGAGIWYQSALYEGDGHRWYRSLWADGGTALITLRDATGKVVADFVEKSSTSGLQLEKEYIYADGQLVALNSTCGPRPTLSLSSDAVVDGQVWFDKSDYVPATGSYTILIKTDQGAMKTVFRPASLPNHFGVPISDLFAGQSNIIQIETDAACGHTGYSNAVAFAYNDSPTAPSCLTAVGVSRNGFSGAGSNLTVVGDGACASGTTYNVHFQALFDELGGIVLNQSGPVAHPEIQLASMPCDAGEGYYWTTPVTGGSEGPPSPIVYAGPNTCGGGSAPVTPGQPTSNLQYVHWDHLGSTRLVTDEEGAVIATSKFFPFGMEAETSGGDELRQKFTGHERDDRVGLDYMMARSCRMSLARFLEPDPYGGSARPPSPQSWNRYAYALNDPINRIDPTGYLDAEAAGTCTADGSCENPGQPGAPSVGNEHPELKALAGDLTDISKGVAAELANTAIGTHNLVAGTINFVLAPFPSLQLPTFNYFEGQSPTQNLAMSATGAVLFAVQGPKPSAGVCFAPGTLVETREGLRPIETLRPDDVVLSRDQGSGQVWWRRITRIFETTDQRVLDLRFERKGTNETLRVTAEHPFWTVHGWAVAAHLEPEMLVLTSSGDWIRLVSATWAPERLVVYNIEVDEFHTYFVGTFGAWVHNSCIDNVRRANSLPGNARLTNNVDDVFRRLAKHNGIEPRLASERLHQIKKANGLGAADNVVFDRTGNVFHPTTGERIGSLTEGGAKAR